MAAPRDFPLSRDALDAQLSVVELIRAMYPPTEGEGDSSVRELLDRLREYCDGSDTDAGSPPPPRLLLPSDLSLTVTIPITVEEDDHMSPSIQMNLVVPLTSSDLVDPVEPPPAITYALRQPDWMSRAEVAELGADMPPGDILAAFDYIQEKAPEYFIRRKNKKKTELPEDEDANNNNSNNNNNNNNNNGPLLRVWFYFPSLSTREKRKDLVTYAPRYRLTGFVLAGKPGVLCVEGTSRDVDSYMNAIKNESWGDIPSHQKKVSERFREECGQEDGKEGGGGGRKFEDMREITDDLGEKRGARKNRGDMAALEAFLKEKGVGESFSKVIMGI